jgi:hypothetical protein
VNAIVLLVVVALGVACGRPASQGTPAAPATKPSPIGNVAPACHQVYEPDSSAYTVVFVGDRVAWIQDTIKERKIAPIGGGEVTTFRVDTRGEIHDAIVVGTDIVITDASADAVRRISLADRKTTTLVEGIRHPYAVAFAGGKYFIGGEDDFYRFDPATGELTALRHRMASPLAARGDIVYVGLEHELLAIDARTGKQTVLVTLPDRGLDSEFTAIAATEHGPVWGTTDRELWTFDLATRRSRKLAGLSEVAMKIEPVGSDLYLAVGSDVQRVRAGRVETLPMDKRGWKDADHPNTRVVAIGVHGDTLVYHVPYTAFASSCLK